MTKKGKSPKKNQSKEEPAAEEAPQDTIAPQQTAPQPTESTTQTGRTRTTGASRSVCAMHKVVMKKAQGKKIKVRYNTIGIPIGPTRSKLQSYIGMLARTMVPIDIPTWPKVDSELKQKLWEDLEATFEVTPESRKRILQSAGAKWRNFKAKLTADHVLPYIGHKKKLMKPPKQYSFVGKEAWKRFVAVRTTKDWKRVNKKHSDIVGNRKYPHRVSRKGYIGLQEEERRKGNLEPDEVPDRALMWKKARMPKGEGQQIDKNLAEINKKIDALMEKQLIGEFKPAGANDVLGTVLETPEHSGRVRGVGNFIPPTMFFDLPKKRRNRVTKEELLARDQQRQAEFEQKTKEFEMQIAELRELIAAKNLQSPLLSDKASCRGEKEQEQEKNFSKPEIVKELVAADEEDEDVTIVDPPPPGKLGPRKCEMAVDNIENKVAFGVAYEEGGEMSATIHGVPLKAGFIRVGVDGSIKGDALVPVPVVGEIETVDQAIGSHLAWPKDMIIFSPTVEKKKKAKVPGELQRVHALFNSVKPKEDVPPRFRVLYKFSKTMMKESGSSIPVPCDVQVFGMERTIYLLEENITALLEFNMIGQAAISTYMAYLHSGFRDTPGRDLSSSFGFLHPATYILNDEFNAYVVQRLREGVNRMNLMPFNYNLHWILVVIWESEIFILNSLPHYPHPDELEKALMRAVRAHNAELGRVIKNPKVKNLPGCPKQPGGTECGYAVMRFMKDLVEDPDMKLLDKWAARSRKTYSKADLDIVRLETLDYIQSIM